MADIAEVTPECANAGNAAAVHSESPAAKSTACDTVCNAAETCESKTDESTETCTKAEEIVVADTTESTCPSTGTKRKSEDVLAEHEEELKKAKSDDAEEKTDETSVTNDKVSNGKTEHIDDARPAEEVESTNGKEASDDVVPVIVAKTVEDVAKLSEEVDA